MSGRALPSQDESSTEGFSNASTVTISPNLEQRSNASGASRDEKMDTIPLESVETKSSRNPKLRPMWVEMTGKAPSGQESALSSQINLLEEGQLPGRSNRSRGCPGFLNFWGIEIVSWVISAILVGAIVVILYIYNGEALPQWPWGITLNTLISFLSALSKASMMVCVTESLGQLKWNYYEQKSRPLEVFDAFDAASRGPVGSMKLLGHGFFTAGRRLATFGALLTILAVASTPFTQQIITYDMRSIIVNHNSTTTRFVEQDLPNTFAVPSVDLKAIQSVYNGIFNQNKTLEPTSPTCSTGNCTLPAYNSLGVCADVANITSYMNRTDDCILFGPMMYQCGLFQLPRLIGMDLMDGPVFPANDTYYDGLLNVTSAAPETGLDPSSFAFVDLNHTYIASAFIMYKDPITMIPTAAEAALHFCVQLFNTTVVNGTSRTTTTRLNSTVAIVGQDVDDQFGAYTYKFTVDGDDTDYHIDQWTIASLGNFIHDQFSGYGWIHWPDGTSYWESPTVEALGNMYSNTTNDAFTEIGIVFDNLATSITNDFRARNAASEEVRGAAWNNETFVKIRWEWMTFLFALLAFSLAFLVMTIVATRDAERVWKTSALATLVGLGGDVRDKLGSVDTLPSLRKNVKTVRVRLKRDGDRWVLAGE